MLQSSFKGGEGGGGEIGLSFSCPNKERKTKNEKVVVLEHWHSMYVWSYVFARTGIIELKSAR